MGCDIHLFTEIKIGGVWHVYSHPKIDRNYKLFAKMANVRNEPKHQRPLSNPRGIPDDASEVVKLALPREAGHSFSWLNAAEIAILENWMEDNIMEEGREWALEMDWWGYFFCNSWGSFMRCPEERPDGVEDIRFVFGFDS